MIMEAGSERASFATLVVRLAEPGQTRTNFAQSKSGDLLDRQQDIML
jgi:hypothetical protein